VQLHVRALCFFAPFNLEEDIVNGHRLCKISELLQTLLREDDPQQTRMHAMGAFDGRLCQVVA
jgi:hypothetical protein